MVFVQLIVVVQAIIFSLFSSILFGKPNLLPLIKFKGTSTNSTALTSNTCTTTCGTGTCAEVTSISGILRSPQYPDFYTQTYDCIYSISVPTGKTITLYIPFAIVPAGDSLSIYDGASVGSVFISSFVNTNAAFTYSFTSSSNSLTIQLKANANNGGGLYFGNYIVQ